MITITAQLSDEAAQALAQFLKRVGFVEWRQNAVDEEEAYLMREGCDTIAKALADAGYDPR